MNKKLIFHGLFAMNIALLIFTIFFIFLLDWGFTVEQLETITTIRMLIASLVFAFWIWCLVIWSKHDKKIGRFLLLFFLIGFYTLFYYRIVLKNKWIDN